MRGQEKLDAWWRTQTDSMAGCVVKWWTIHYGIVHWAHVRNWISVEGIFWVGERGPTQVQAVRQDQANIEKATNDRARFLSREKDFMREYGAQRGMR